MGREVSAQAINRISAVAPVVLSLLAFVLVLFAVGTGWGQVAGDEGAAAHLFWLLIAAQAPFVVAFLATADWERGQRVAGPLALQVVAIALAFAPVAYFRL